MYVLIILIVLTLLCIGLVILAIKSDEDEIAFFPSVLGILFLSIVIALLCNLIHNHSDNYVNRKIIEHDTLQQQLDESRKDANGIERAAIFTKILEYNQQLAQDRYDDSTQWDYWQPDTLSKLKPIK